MKKLEVYYDKNTKDSGGCGCGSCSCGSNEDAMDMDTLITELNSYEFDEEVEILPLKVSEMDQTELITKLNVLLESASANFRADADNLEDVISNIFPLTVLDNSVLTAYDIPTLYDVVAAIDKQNK